jgi:hypothetical protein
MRPFRGFVWGCALAALAAGAAPATAGWNNAFQVCCHNCRSGYAPAPPPVVAAYPAAPACPQPCPQPCQQCTTRYVQRCYYQPVTTYRQVSYLEPVTTYRTSFFYEAVTSCHCSCYFDPCTCSYRQGCQPVTSFVLRSQCCPVTSYLQRCALQPVTVMQQVNYLQPVTTCCQTTIGAPLCSAPAGAVAAPAVPAPAAPAAPAPGTSEQSAPPFVPAPGTSEGAAPGTSEGSTSRDKPPTTAEPPLRMPPADGSLNRQPQLRAPLLDQPRNPQNTPRARPDRIASRGRWQVEGRLLSRDRVPQGNVRVLLVNVDPRTDQQSATTNRDGRFRATLEAGEWLVYVQDASGRPVFHQRVKVGGSEPLAMTLVSR